MLGKLLKYEFRQNLFTLILIAIFITVFTGITLVFGVFPAIYISNTDFSLVAFISIFASMVAYVIVLIAVTMGMNIYIGLRYYKTMYSHTGYMTNTLPLNVHELILGKIISGFVILVIVNLLILLSGSVLKEIYVMGVGGIGDTADRFLSYFNRFYIVSNFDYQLSTIFYLIDMVIDVLMITSLLFLSVTIGQLFNTHRVLMSVVIFVGINICISTINSIISIAFGFLPMGLNYVLDYNAIPSLIVSIIESISLIVVSYMLSYYIIKRRLNLE